MRKPFILFLISVLWGILMTSCITTRQTNYMQKSSFSIPSYTDSVPYQEYKLKEGDRLFIQVYSMDDKTNALFNGSSNMSRGMMSGGSENLDLYTYIIQPNGSILFPLVGEVFVIGKTIREAKEAIEKAIAPVLEINSVDVRIVSRTFSIIGAGKAGRYNFPREKVNIYQALAIAGDLGFYVDRSKIKILRESEKGVLIKEFDVRSIDVINSEFYYLEPNDIIFLQPLKQQFFRVSSLWSAISTIITTYSFGVIVYKSFIEKPVENSAQ